MEKKPPYIPPRPYAHLIVELDDEPLGDLRRAINGVAGRTLVGACYPPLDDPARLAEGCVEPVAEAHRIDIEADDYAAYDAAIAALERVIRRPREREYPGDPQSGPVFYLRGPASEASRP